MEKWEKELREKLEIELPDRFKKEYPNGGWIVWMKSDYIELQVMNERFIQELFYAKNI